MNRKSLELSRAQKRAVVFVGDAMLCVASVLFAYYLRLGYWVIPVGTQWLSVFAALVFALPLFVTFGLYRVIFRYIGWSTLGAAARAAFIYGLAYASVFSVVGVNGVPRTIGLIQPMLLFLGLGVFRAGIRFWFGGGIAGLFRVVGKQRVLIYGAGAAGRQLAAAFANSPDTQVVGFIDDDTTLQGSVLNGKKIFSSKDLKTLLEKTSAEAILLAMPSIMQNRRKEILENLQQVSVVVRTLPGLMDLAQGRVSVSDLRELDIADLLGRSSVSPNQILLGKNISSKIVVVTGAGGSIGSELCRQIIQLRPTKLLLVESSEFALYSIHNELLSKVRNLPSPEIAIVPLLASVQNAHRMKEILETWRPDTVYHTAAYKHVPLVEHNVMEGVSNNVFGTFVTASMAMECGVQDFVLISTDKAVRPTNVMGASKRVAEMLLQALADKGSNTCFSMVRFGNVLGSSGSVVPLFRQQIRDGGPITITHENITRYFMTIPEAAQLVIQAGAMANGGEVFVLDMGNPVRIIDLAQRMVELSGLKVRSDDTPDGDIEISVIGLRPGEKLYEELLIGDNPSPTRHPQIMMARDQFLKWSAFQSYLDKLNAAIQAGDAMLVRSILIDLVAGFTPHETVVDWVQQEKGWSAVSPATERG